MSVGLAVPAVIAGHRRLDDTGALVGRAVAERREDAVARMQAGEVAFLHHHAPVEMRKTLMNIVGCNVQSVGHTVRGKDPDQEAARKKGRRADG